MWKYLYRESFGIIMDASHTFIICFIQEVHVSEVFNILIKQVYFDHIHRCRRLLSFVKLCSLFHVVKCGRTYFGEMFGSSKQQNPVRSMLVYCTVWLYTVSKLLSVTSYLFTFILLLKIAGKWGRMADFKIKKVISFFIYIMVFYKLKMCLRLGHLL